MFALVMEGGESQLPRVNDAKGDYAGRSGLMIHK
jgi:hypothetical protein